MHVCMCAKRNIKTRDLQIGGARLDVYECMMREYMCMMYDVRLDVYECINASRCV